MAKHEQIDAIAYYTNKYVFFHSTGDSQRAEMDTLAAKISARQLARWALNVIVCSGKESLRLLHRAMMNARESNLPVSSRII